MKKEQIVAVVPLLDALGIKPDFVDGEGPPADEDKLRRYMNGELGPFAAEEVRACIVSFRPWYQAFVEAIGEQKE